MIRAEMRPGVLPLDVVLAYRRQGQGPRTVLFLHGLFARGADLGALASALVGDRSDTCAVLPDLLGHGDSPPLPPGAELATVGAQLVALLDELEVTGPVPVVAHSMGGRVALRAVDRWPERFGPLVFIDTPPGNLQSRRSPLSPFIRALERAPERAGTVDELMAPFERVLMGQALRDWIRGQIVDRGAESFGWAFERGPMIDYRWRTMGEDLWPVVDRLGPQQLTVLAPVRSTYVRKEDRERYAESGIEVTLVEGVGHDMHQALPDSARQIMRAALERG